MKYHAVSLLLATATSACRLQAAPDPVCREGEILVGRGRDGVCAVDPATLQCPPGQVAAIVETTARCLSDPASSPDAGPLDAEGPRDASTREDAGPADAAPIDPNATRFDDERAEHRFDRGRFSK